MKSSLLRRLLFWAAALFAFVMALLPHPPRVPGDPPDKIQHVIAFAALGLLAPWAYTRAPLVRLLVGLSLFGAVIELLQAFPALNRDSDAVDWVADTVACALMLAVVSWRRSRQAR